MFSKWHIFVLICFCGWTISAEGQRVKNDNILPTLIVGSCCTGKSFNGEPYDVLPVYIVNSGDDTLKFWDTNSKFKNLFFITGRKAVTVVNGEIGVHPFKQNVVPPHRSIKYELPFSVDKAAGGTVELKVGMKFYKCFNNMEFENEMKFRKPEIVSDKIIMSIYGHPTNKYRSVGFSEKEDKRMLVLPDINFYILSEVEKKRYKLSVDKKTISKKLKGGESFPVTVTINNASNDTLKYETSANCWSDFYHVDNKKFSVVQECDKNEPMEVVLPPRSSRSETITIYCKDNLVRMELLRVGFHLCEEQTPQHANQSYYFDPYGRYNMIWSDEVSISPR
jgi:WD40 repeat protein